MTEPRAPQPPPLPALAELVADVSALIAPPVVCARIHDLIDSPWSSAEDIGELVALDPSLTARLLRIVNSSYFGFTAPIESLARAVTVLGTRDLYNLAVAISAMRSFSGLAAGLVSFDSFWHHSIFVSLLSRELARRLAVPEPDRLFVAGLLHDVGSPALYAQRPDLVAVMRAEGRRDEASLHAAERARLGFSHAEVGALLLETWPLPEPLAAAVRYHHEPAAAEAGTEAALLSLADGLAAGVGDGASCPEAAAPVAADSAVWRILGTGPEELALAAVVDAANHQFAEVAAALLRE